MEYERKRVMTAMSITIAVLGIVAVMESAAYLWSLFLAAGFFFLAYKLYRAGK